MPSRLRISANGTQMCQVYTGDDHGRVFMTSLVPTAMSSTSAAAKALDRTLAVLSIRQSPSGALLQGRGDSQQIFSGDSKIVQLQCQNGRVIVTNLSRAYVVHTRPASSGADGSPDRGTKVVQVGQKPRKGPYGACFDPNSNGRQLLAARPGKRLWVADSHSGEVLRTVK